MAQVVKRLLESLAQFDDQSFLGRAYIALLGRPIDPVGLRDYLTRLRAGASRENICNEIANSDEGRAHAAASNLQFTRSPNPGLPGTRDVGAVSELLALDDQAFVRQAFLILLGREADPTGLHDYTKRIRSGESKMQIIAEIHGGPEGRANGARIPGLAALFQGIGEQNQSPMTLGELLDLQGDAFVRGAFRLILGREADPEGLDTYARLLRAGMSRMFVAKEIATSEEGRSRAGTISGLHRAIRNYEIANSRTWKGWYYREVRGLESDFALERYIRAIYLESTKSRTAA